MTILRKKIFVNPIISPLYKLTIDRAHPDKFMYKQITHRAKCCGST